MKHTRETSKARRKAQVEMEVRQQREGREGREVGCSGKGGAEESRKGPRAADVMGEGATTPHKTGLCS